MVQREGEARKVEYTGLSKWWPVSAEQDDPSQCDENEEMILVVLRKRSVGRLVRKMIKWQVPS